jgi:hypothetical protein
MTRIRTDILYDLDMAEMLHDGCLDKCASAEIHLHECEAEETAASMTVEQFQQELAMFDEGIDYLEPED